jgi:hypothetical protein
MNGIALGLTHKGARGRLAKVDSKELHAFLRERLSPQQRSKAWIGLRYYCNYHVSMWNDGTRLNRTDFQIWSPHWAAGTYAQCVGADGFYPAYYLGPEEGFMWALTGSKKHYNEMYVEFPTNGE